MSNPVDVRESDPKRPHLGIRVPGEQAIPGRKHVVAQLVVAALHVDGDQPSVVARLDNWPNPLVQLVRHPGVVFHAVLRDAGGHGSSPGWPASRHLTRYSATTSTPHRTAGRLPVAWNDSRSSSVTRTPR